MDQADIVNAVKNFRNAFEEGFYQYSDAGRVEEDLVPKLAEDLNVTPAIAKHFALYYFVVRKNYIKPDYSNSKKAELDGMLVESATTIGLDRASIDELKKFILEKAYYEKARLERLLQPHIQRFRSRSNRSRKSRSKRNRKTRKSRK
jgi:hypothetical protein